MHWIFVCKDYIYIYIMGCKHQNFFMSVVVAGEALCLPTVLFYRWWWFVRDSWSGNQPNCHPVTPQETLCRSETSVLIYLFFSCRALHRSITFTVISFVSRNLLVYYLGRHPQCSVWWAMPAHCCHVFFGGGDSATQKPNTDLQPRWGKALVQNCVWMYTLYALCWMYSIYDWTLEALHVCVYVTHWNDSVF